MTAHLDDDTLTALALGHRDAGAEGVADHLRVCPACAAALADPGYGRTPSGAWLVPVDRTGVVGVELVTPEGKVWASAPL